MNYENVLKELYSLDSSKVKLGLTNIKTLLKKLGNPEKQLKCIHVAGTNGKGSVCAMISSILIDANCKTGMYTSPHLKRFNERIRINDKLISDKEIVRYYLKVKKYVTNQSFFEITTAMAFLYFKEKKVDFAVLEVGLGGRLDATNVVKPLISIITNIELEHTKILGNTLRKIAYEKAGIIKKNVPVITAAQGTALQTIKKISNKKNSELITINNDNLKIKCSKKIFNKNNINYKKINNIDNKIINNKKLKNYNENNESKNNSIEKNNWTFDYNNYKNIELENLNGKFQIVNAAIAVKAIDTVKSNYNIKINKKNIINGLKNAKWHGRFQFIGKNVIVDCAHNPSGFRILINELKNINYHKLVLVVGFSDDKDIEKISNIIKNKYDKIIITKSNNERAAEPKLIKKHFNKNPIIIKNPKKALNYTKKIASKKDLILVTGSIFLIGELL